MLTPTLETWGQLLAGISGLLLAFALLGAAEAKITLDDLESIDPSQGTTVSGILLIHHKTIELVSGTGPIFNCPKAYCGFRGIQAFANQAVTLKMSNARIIEIRSQASTLDALNKRISDEKSWQGSSAVAGIVGALMSWLAYRLRGKSIRKTKRAVTVPA